jgi:disulfide bond formation protein DsbB
MPPLTLRSFLIATAAFCVGLLAYAAYLQHGPQFQQPCPLCVLQRYVYIAIALVAALGAWRNQIGYVFGVEAVALGGVGLAGWQVAKGSTMTACQADPIGQFVNGLPTADLFPQYFFANGGCADRYDALGLPVPVWSLICFGGIAAAAGLMAWRQLIQNRKP